MSEDSLLGGFTADNAVSQDLAIWRSKTQIGICVMTFLGAPEGQSYYL